MTQPLARRPLAGRNAQNHVEDLAVRNMVVFAVVLPSLLVAAVAPIPARRATLRSE